MQYKESPNKHKRIAKITGIVIHTTVGSYSGAVSWLTNPQSGVSAHYVIKEDGSEVTQCVTDDYVAYHVGVVYKPTTPVYKGGNPNEYTIGIENADNGKPHLADRTAQYGTLIQLVYDLCVRHKLPINREFICGHKEIRANKTCPGNIDVDYVIREARRLAGTPPENNMTDLYRYLGVSNDAEAKVVLEKHLGERDDRCQWGAQPESGAENFGGYLGSDRRTIAEFGETDPDPVEPQEEPTYKGSKANGVQIHTTPNNVPKGKTFNFDPKTDSIN